MIVAAWIYLALGIGRTLMGLVMYRKRFGEALAEGGFGKFQGIDSRRVAFWFTFVGPLLILIGHLALHAAQMGDVTAFKMVGVYSFCVSVLGVSALPKSPIWAVLILSLVFVAFGFGWIA